MFASFSIVGLSVGWLLWCGYRCDRLSSESPLYRAAWWQLVVASGLTMAALVTTGDLAVRGYVMEHTPPWLFAALAVVAVLGILTLAVFRLTDAPVTPFDH